MQEKSDIIRRLLRRNMLQTNLQSAPNKIDNQGPFEIAVAISTDHLHGPTGRAQFVEDPFRTNIAEMTNLIRVSRQDRDFLGQTIVCIGQNKNAQWLGHLLNRELRG